MKYASVSFVPPPEGVFVHTKISDEHGDRNFQEMKFERNLWWTRDGMYVYYRPTHWAYIEARTLISDYQRQSHYDRSWRD